LIVKLVPAAHVWSTLIVHGPDPVTDSAPGVQEPVEVVVLVAAVGAVHPAGTTNVTYELDGKVSSVGAVNVNPS